MELDTESCCKKVVDGPQARLEKISMSRPEAKVEAATYSSVLLCASRDNVGTSITRLLQLIFMTFAYQNIPHICGLFIASHPSVAVAQIALEDFRSPVESSSMSPMGQFEAHRPMDSLDYNKLACGPTCGPLGCRLEMVQLHAIQSMRI